MIGKLIGKGRTAEIFEYGSNQIVKLYLKKFEEGVEYEFNLCTQICRQYQLTPKAYKIARIDNRSGIIFDKINGVSLGQAISQYPFRTAMLGKQAAKAHVEVNKLTCSGIIDQQTMFEQRLAEINVLDTATKERIIQSISSLPKGNGLCHGDLHTENYMYINKGLQVIDWVSAYSGHPAGDVARVMLLMQSPSITHEMPWYKKMIAKHVLKVYLKNFYRTYLSQSSITKNEINQFVLPVAAIRLTENVPNEQKWLLSIIKKELKKQP